MNIIYDTTSKAFITLKSKVSQSKHNLCYSLAYLWRFIMHDIAPNEPVTIIADQPTLYPSQHGEKYTTEEGRTHTRRAPKVLDVTRYLITHGHTTTVHFASQNTGFTIPTVYDRTLLSIEPTATYIKPKERKLATPTTDGREWFQPNGFYILQDKRIETSLTPTQWAEVEYQLTDLKRYTSAYQTQLDKEDYNTDFADIHNITTTIQDIATDATKLQHLVAYVNTWAQAYDIPTPNEPRTMRISLQEFAHNYLTSDTISTHSRDNITIYSEESNSAKHKDTRLQYFNDLITAAASISFYRKNNFPLSFGWVHCPHCNRPINAEGNSTQRQSRATSAHYDYTDGLYHNNPDTTCQHCFSEVPIADQIRLLDLKRTLEHGAVYARDAYLDEWYAAPSSPGKADYSYTYANITQTQPTPT